MKTELLKEKIREYPVVVGATLVILVAGGIAYSNDGQDLMLQEAHASKERELAEMKSNQLNAKDLLSHVNRAKLLSDQIKAQALDLDSMIESQSFLTGLVQKSNYVKIEGLPTQQSLPVANPSLKPLATCGYLLHATGDFNSLARLAMEVGLNARHAMSVVRVQFIAPETTKTKNESIEGDLVFQLWGKKGGDFSPITSGREKKVPVIASRVAQLNQVEKVLNEKSIEVASFANLFGASTGNSASSGQDVSLDNVLTKLEFKVIEFVGRPAIQLEGIGIKRINTDFDVKVDGKTMKLKITAIDEVAHSFTVVTPFGKKLTFVQKK